ncbi:MAG: GDP-L-fucose synthase [Alphaproteobacteria bacterium]|jgi:GDP-L-fucose synthase|nr:GDP-L-fucose synthase [Alphaproteobacteria bacterium]
MSPPLLFDLAGGRIAVCGHKGMAGSAIVRRLASERCEIITADRTTVDLTHEEPTAAWLARTKPDALFLAAARVGGIHANSSYPANFIADNLAIELNVMRSALASGVKKLLFLGSSCIYPKFAPQPIKEDALLTGALEPTNEWYSLAKITGIKLALAYRRQYGADFISIMPTNLYGPADNYHPEDSHVPAALIRRFHEAKISGQSSATVWGSGQVRREFMAADDLGDACVFVMKHYSGDDFLNVGTGEDITIADFARLVADVVGFDGTLKFDISRPDGPPRKLLDVSRLSALGWRAKTPLRAGLAAAYADFLGGGGRGRD